MLTEEKIQKFIDDLRVGKYDNERYEISPNGYIKDTKTDIEICIDWYTEAYEWKQVGFWIFKRWKSFKYKEPKYFINIDNTDYPVEVTEELYNSVISYFRELGEKDKLLRRLNIKESFGLD